MTPRILIVGCGFPQLGLIRFCKAEGLFVVGADLNPEAVGALHCNAFARASTTSVPELVRAIRDHRVDGITTAGSEHALVPTAIAAHEAGLPFYALPDALLAFCSKARERELYRRAGAPIPEFRLAEDNTQARAAALGLGLPVVLKPTRGWGQRGVSIVRHEAELPEATARALDASAHAGQPGTCLVEAFAPGREFSVNAYSVEGVTEVLAITERIITGYPDPPGITFAEVYPPELPEAALGKLAEAARQGVRALGIRRGPTYTQLRYDGQRAVIIETAHRCGGGLDPEVTFLASGVSLYRRLCGAALGVPDWERSGSEAPAHAGAIGRFLVGEPGKVARVLGIDLALASPGVLDAQVYVGPGDRVHPLTDGSKRVGHVVVVGTSRKDVEARAAVAQGLIHIETVPALAEGLAP